VDDRRRQRSAFFRSSFLLEPLILDLLVALEGGAFDDPIFDHLHDDPVVPPRDGHVLEQVGRIERFQRLIETAGIEPGTRLIKV
jgi:hypothetical protein